VSGCSRVELKLQKINHFISGKQTPPLGGGYIENFEPATGEVYSYVADGCQHDVNAAVASARAAFPAWAGLSGSERGSYLERIADLIDANTPRLAAAESCDTGKPIRLAASVDIPRSAANLRYFAAAAQHTASECFDFDGSGTPNGQRSINYTLRTPRGVAGCISPWNLPLYLLTWKIAPALATGNTVVAKPSEVTPMTASLLSHLCEEAGLPAGVLNIVHGAGAGAGAAIVHHVDVPTLTFTGSTAVGRWIGKHAAEQLKRVSLELGGRNPFLIFGDVNVKHASALAARAAFTNQGQICLCGSRLIVHRSIADEVTAQLVQHAEELRIGDPNDSTTQFGSLVSNAHLEKVSACVRAAEQQGARVLTGGERVPPHLLPARCRGGAYFAPTVLDGMDPRCSAEQEEIFGPVVSIQRFDTEEEAIQLANGTNYGLAAVIMSENIGTIQRMTRALAAGIVWVNCWMVRDLRTPFGGVKASGIGREGGNEALRFFTEPKNVCILG